MSHFVRSTQQGDNRPSRDGPQLNVISLLEYLHSKSPQRHFEGQAKYFINLEGIVVAVKEQGNKPGDAQFLKDYRLLKIHQTNGKELNIFQKEGGTRCW